MTSTGSSHRPVQLLLPLRFHEVFYEVAVIEGTKKHRSQEPAVATEFYRSTLFQLALERARREHDDFVILSAWYGLVEQLEVLEPYEISLRDLAPKELRAWAAKVAVALSDLYLHEQLHLIAYASPQCVQALRRAVRRIRPRWSLKDPLHGLSWRGRETWFKQRAAEA